MKLNFAAMLVAMRAAFGATTPPADYQAPTRLRRGRVRAAKVKTGKGEGLRACKADRYRPAPWIPNIAGKRYEKGRYVDRSN